MPIKLKFLQAMGFAPANIIANARLLRNKLEHYYKKPSNEEVSNAIELAELFILATDNKLKSLWDFLFCDRVNYVEGSFNRGLYIKFKYEKRLFEVQAIFSKDKRKKMLVKNTTIEFYYLLKIATSFDYEEDVRVAATDLIEHSGHPIPRNKIMFEICN